MLASIGTVTIAPNNTAILSGVSAEFSLGSIRFSGAVSQPIGQIINRISVGFFRS